MGIEGAADGVQRHGRGVVLLAEVGQEHVGGAASGGGDGKLGGIVVGEMAAPAQDAKILDLQRANEEPLLRAACGNAPDLDRMTRNAMKRNGGTDHE